MSRKTPIVQDAIGQSHPPAGSDARILSLVPSITELLFDLGLKDQIVGRTGFCVHPAKQVKLVPKVGGTKDVKLDKIRELAPSHVIVNIDENTREVFDALRAFVPHIVVTHPNAPQDNPGLFQLLGGIFGKTTEATRLTRRYEDAEQMLTRAAADRPRRRVLYLIWKDPWMSVAPDTYIGNTLALAGLDVVTRAAGPDGPDGARYPVVEKEQFDALDAVLLSSEPYPFQDWHVDAVAARFGAPASIIDGEMTSWYGSRAITGMGYLTDFAEQLANPGGAVSAAAAAPVDTPCIGICRMDRAQESCVGCGRSLDQIAGWHGYSQSQRKAIMETLKPSPMGRSRSA